MGTISNNLFKIEQAGYIVKGNFVLVIIDWTIHFYYLQQINLNRMKKYYTDHIGVNQVIDILQMQIDVSKGG